MLSILFFVWPLVNSLHCMWKLQACVVLLTSNPSKSCLFWPKKKKASPALCVCVPNIFDIIYFKNCNSSFFFLVACNSSFIYIYIYELQLVFNELKYVLIIFIQKSCFAILENNLKCFFFKEVRFSHP